MRIVMIGPFGLNPKGTMRARALPLARELAARGHAIKLIMPPWHTPQEAGRSWEEAGVMLEYVRLGPDVCSLSHLILPVRLVRAALAWHPEIIHCFKPKGYAGAAAWFLWSLRRLGFVRVHLVIDEDDWEGMGGWNDLEPYPPLLRAVFAWQERWGLRHNDAVTTASRTLQSLIWSLGVPPRKVCYLPNGAYSPREGDGMVVREKYSLGSAPVVLLYTRFFEYDVARVVAVFREIKRQLPEARLLVVGQALFAEDEARFDRLVEEAGLRASVVRAGWVPQEDLPDYFAATDVALYPFDDTLVNRAKCSVKLIELLAAGVAVVADAVGQNTEYIIHRETGLLVPSGDVSAMASEAVRLLREPALRRALGQAAAKHIAERYAWHLLVEELLALYAGLVEHARAERRRELP